MLQTMLLFPGQNRGLHIRLKLQDLELHLMSLLQDR